MTAMLDTGGYFYEAENLALAPVLVYPKEPLEPEQ